MDIEQLRDGGVILETGPSPAAAVIWLHGLGADGHDFESIIPQIPLKPEPGVQFILPHAPIGPVTINGGREMRSWYDIAAGGEGFTTDEAGLRESSAYIESLIEQLLRSSSPPEKLFLAGFSQGGAVMLHTALRTRYLLSGVIALSTYLPLADKAEAELNRNQSSLDIFMAHGTTDPVINYEWASRSRDKLAALGAQIEWHEYAMGHAVCSQEMEDLSVWMRQRL
jgi:phospholipase/carboxylesterase